MLLRARHRSEIRAGSPRGTDPTADDYLVVITTPETFADRLSWRTLLAATGYAHLLTLGIVSIAVSRGVGPVRVLLLCLMVVALSLLRKPGHTGVLPMLVAAAAVTGDIVYLGGMTGAFHPSSAAQFVTSVASIAAFCVTVVAVARCLRTRDGGAAPHRSAVTAAAGGLLAAGMSIVVAVGAAVAYDAPTPATSDVRLRASNSRCTPDTLRAAAGPVSLFVRNDDGSRHTISVAELGVVLGVPAHRAARTEFTAAPGRYVFVCQVHGRGRRVSGELVVE